MTFENVDGFTNYNQSYNDGLETLSTCKLNEISKILSMMNCELFQK